MAAQDISLIVKPNHKHRKNLQRTFCEQVMGRIETLESQYKSRIEGLEWGLWMQSQLFAPISPVQSFFEVQPEVEPLPAHSSSTPVATSPSAVYNDIEKTPFLELLQGLDDLNRELCAKLYQSDDCTESHTRAGDLVLEGLASVSSGIGGASVDTTMSPTGW